MRGSCSAILLVISSERPVLDSGPRLSEEEAEVPASVATLTITTHAVVRRSL